MKKTIAVIVLLTLAVLKKLDAQSVKVFILAGQSNMVGAGQVFDDTKLGTLEHFLKTDATKEYQDLLDQQGNFISRDDVWVRYNRGDMSPILLNNDWTIGYGSGNDRIGPEYGFGRQLGNYYNDKVLIIKTAWGGKSLGEDFRPPSSGGTVGPYYTRMLNDISEAITNIATEFPQYTGTPVEIIGFGWFQGWNDAGNQTFIQNYTTNLINFIKDVRSDLKAPDMKFVIANSGHGGLSPFPDVWFQRIQNEIVPAQAAAANFSGHQDVGLVDTRDLWRDVSVSPADAGHHFNDNGETFLKIGNDMGVKMIELIKANVTFINSSITTAPIKIYPNPVSESFIIENENSKVKSIHILNITGKIIRTITHSSQTIDVSDLKSGIYFIELATINSKQTTKFIKQ